MSQTTDEIKCSICFEDGIDFTTLCSHKFHRSCFDSWYAEDQSCPLCRSKYPVLSLRMFIENGDMVGFEEFMKKENWQDEICEKTNWLIHHCACYGNLEMMKKILLHTSVDKTSELYCNTALMIASKRKCIDMVQFLIDAGANINLRNTEDESALDICITLGAENIMRLLLARNPSEKTKNQAIMTAIFEGSVSAMEILHQAGADLECKEAKNGWNTLLYAASENKVEIIEYLLTKGLDIDSKGKFNETALILACRNKHFETAKYLIQHGCLINSQNQNGGNALMAASSSRMAEIVAMLIDKNASLLETDDEGLNVLDFAIEGGDPEIIKLIIEAAEKVPITTTENEPITLANQLLNSLTKMDETPLNFAIRKGNMELVTYLVEKGANVNHQDDRGISYFLEACSCHNMLILKFFVEEIGCDIESATEDGVTGLMLAASAGNVLAISYLLDKGAKIDRVSGDNRTALIFAADYQAADCLQVLASEGANLNVITDEGDTALTIACNMESARCVSVLMKAGADSSIRDAIDWCPLQIAINNKNFASVKHLVAGGADVNIYSDDPETMIKCPIVMAMMSKRVDIVNYLLQNGAKVSIVNEIGQTPLHLACIKKYIRISLALIQHGACINARDNQGATPLMICEDKGYTELVKLLLDHGADANANDVVEPLHS